LDLRRKTVGCTPSQRDLEDDRTSSSRFFACLWLQRATAFRNADHSSESTKTSGWEDVSPFPLLYRSGPRRHDSYAFSWCDLEAFLTSRAKTSYFDNV
jgi:hypothetical protein